MTARRKKRPKKSCFSISSKRRCDAVKRGWCSIVKSAVGEASDRIWAVVVYQSVLRRSDRGVCFFVLLSQYHCLEEAESKVYPSISLFYTVPHLWLFYIKWLQYGKPLTKIQGLTFDPENLGPRVHDKYILVSFRRGTKMFKSRVRPWIWYILKSEDFRMDDSDEEKKREKSILKLDPRPDPGFEHPVARSCHAP